MAVRIASKLASSAAPKVGAPVEPKLDLGPAPKLMSAPCAKLAQPAVRQAGISTQVKLTRVRVQLGSGPCSSWVRTRLNVGVISARLRSGPGPAGAYYPNLGLWPRQVAGCSRGRCFAGPGFKPPSGEHRLTVQFSGFRVQNVASGLGAGRSEARPSGSGV